MLQYERQYCFIKTLLFSAGIVEVHAVSNKMYVQRNIVARSCNHFAVEMQQCLLCVSVNYVSLLTI